MADSLSYYEYPSTGAPVSVVSVPLEFGSDERGFAEAPEHLFASGLERMLGAVKRDLASKTVIECVTPPLSSVGHMKYAEDIAAIARKTTVAVERALEKKHTVIALGGDHAMALGTLAGVAAARPSIGVVYIDAHPDCQTERTTLTGNVHGMVTAAAMGAGHALLTGLFPRPIAPEQFAFIGCKDIDEAEITFLRERKAACVTMLDISMRGLLPAIEAIDALAKRSSDLWISLDMDGIDEAHAPGVGLPNKGGLTRREVLSLAQYIGKRHRVAGFDIVEILPERDKEGKTAQLAIELAARFLGGEYGWYQQTYIGTYRDTNAA